MFKVFSTNHKFFCFFFLDKDSNIYRKRIKKRQYEYSYACKTFGKSVNQPSKTSKLFSFVNSKSKKIPYLVLKSVSFFFSTLVLSVSVIVSRIIMKNVQKGEKNILLDVEKNSTSSKMFFSPFWTLKKIQLALVTSQNVIIIFVIYRIWNSAPAFLSILFPCPKLLRIINLSDNEHIFHNVNEREGS